LAAQRRHPFPPGTVHPHGARAWHDRALVFFCEPQCWMSWNAALRAVEYGYTAVHYFPDGVQGWADEGLPVAEVEPEPPH